MHINLDPVPCHMKSIIAVLSRFICGVFFLSASFYIFYTRYCSDMFEAHRMGNTGFNVACSAEAPLTVILRTFHSIFNRLLGINEVP